MSIKEKKIATLQSASLIKGDYHVPINWQWVTIKDLCKLKNGRAFKPSEWTDHGLPIIRIQNLNNLYSAYNYYSGNVSEEYLLHGGELLFAWSGTPGTSFGAHEWTGGDAVLNQHIFRVDYNKSAILKLYFMYAMNQQLDRLISAAHGGAGLQHVTKGVFESTPIPLPPLPEQQRIVDRIESLFAKLDEAKDKAQAVIDGYESRKVTILHQAFTGELTREWRNNKHIALDSWQHYILKDIATSFKYGTSEKSDYTYMGIPVLRIPNIGENKLTFDDIKYLPESNNIQHLVNENDILLIRSNGSRDLVGKCAVVPKIDRPYAYASFLIKIVPSSLVLSEFLSFFLNSAEARSQMFAKAKSSAGIHNINSKELGEIKLNLPTLPEQIKIISELTNSIAKEKAILDLALSAVLKIESMKKAILARAFRGELGTNDPTEAPVDLSSLE